MLVFPMCISGGKTCINTVGSFRCECPNGYRDDQHGVCEGRYFIVGGTVKRVGFVHIS